MDYRRSLFQLEQWSPFLARKFWSLSSFLDTPLAVALGLKVNTLSDFNVEVEIPATRFNKDESGQIRSSALVAVGEFATKILWRRHLDPGTESLFLDSLHCRFLKTVTGAVKARAQLTELERERVLRKIRLEGQAQCEVSVLFFDRQDQQTASLSCVWHMKALVPTALQQGREKA